MRGELTRNVRDLASERGVSERTAWRYLSRMRAGERLPAPDRACALCGDALPSTATIRRLYCGTRCRVTALRRREAHDSGRNGSMSNRVCASGGGSSG
jgi:hypothetical protein